jgi:hypothetical protein
MKKLNCNLSNSEHKTQSVYNKCKYKLYCTILGLKQDISLYSVNPVLDAFNLDDCSKLDSEYYSDEFIRKKVDECLKLLNGIGLDFNPKFNSAYEIYNEAVIYFYFKNRFQIQPIKEEKYSTPDFHIKLKKNKNDELYLEVKALSYLQGSLNYLAAQKDGLNSRVSTENQLKSGKQITFSEMIISPFQKDGSQPTKRELIEIYIEKIKQNIKENQYKFGESILLVDTKQLLLGSRLTDSAVALYQERLCQSIASGLLWHVAFGNIGNMIYQPIEFEGAKNTAGLLEKEGILSEHKFIKGLIFVVYENFEIRKNIGFYRYDEQDCIAAEFINDFCDFWNDDNNSEAWKYLQEK